jgi:Phosphotransferase enzyme family
VINVAGDAGPAWLTAVLRESGALTSGRVETVDQDLTSAFNSSTAQLRLRYSRDARPGLPTELILKQNTAQAWSVRAAQDEVAFYRLVARSAGHPAGIVACLAAGTDEQTGDSFVLLKDMSGTHRVVVPRDVQIGMVDAIPPDAQVMAVVDTLARLHAYWWERVTEPVGVTPWARDQAGFSAYLEHRTAAWRSVVRDHGRWLPAEVPDLYQQVLAELPGYWERELRDRMRQRRQLTLVHGDAYFANFLGPITPGVGATYLIDWQSPSFDIGAADLANLCATWWTAGQRSEDRREERILHRYHDELLRCGVTAYSLEDLRADYVRALIDWVLVPVQDAADGSDVDYWWPKMQNLMAAFRDWNCEVMLSPRHQASQ